jgi:hypothetical protein
VSGSDFNARNTQCIPACPVGLADRTGVVKIFAILDLEQISVDFENEYFSKVSGCYNNLLNFIHLPKIIKAILQLHLILSREK